jgi:hypothetical protein
MRAVQFNIGLNLVDDPDKLAAMHVAYRLLTAPETVTRLWFIRAYTMICLETTRASKPPRRAVFISAASEMFRDALPPRLTAELLMSGSCQLMPSRLLGSPSLS